MRYRGSNMFKNNKKRNIGKGIVYSVRKILIFGIFGLAIIYFIIISIFYNFRKEEGYDIDNIQKYIEEQNTNQIDESKLVKDYTNFYTIQDILEQFTDSVIDRKYSQTYKLLGNEMLKKYSKEEYIEKIKSFSNENLIEKDPDVSYSNRNELKKLYKISDKNFLAEYCVSDGTTKRIGVRILEKNKYEIFYIEM